MLSAPALNVATGEPPAPTPERAAEYAADVVKSVIALQQFRESSTVEITGPDGRAGKATLVSLNPHIGAWFLLRLDWADGASATYHLENPVPAERQLLLDGNPPGALLLREGGVSRRCAPWSEKPSALAQAANAALPFAPLCESRIHLRNRVAGRRTNLEKVTELLRDQGEGGEAVVGFVRRQFFADAFLDNAEPADSAAPIAAPATDAPPSARLGDGYAGQTVSAPNLGIMPVGTGPGALVLGHWYQAAGLEGVHVGVMQAGAVASDIFGRHRDRVNALDAVESKALVYLVAFDLDRHTLGWSHGTDYPGVGWSPRPPAKARDPALPGPDGFATLAPLITTGALNPALVGRAVATFAGGFKRQHGAFRYGDMALARKGHHYGFIENGVVLSKLQPGLATLYVLNDGRVGMKTWTEADQPLLPLIAHARQNGVPLIAPDPATGDPLPGARVNQWGAGNWSGSAEGKLRTVRAGACLTEAGTRRFLVYAYFSSVTPSAMARVFEAYGCRYAMQLDMNAPVHTYAAVYPRREDRVVVEHLVESMAEADEVRDGKVIPRFLGFADNRDFFYLLRSAP